MAASMSSNSDDDVPPLDDMTDLLEQVKQIQKSRETCTKPTTSAPPASLARSSLATTKIEKASNDHTVKKSNEDKQEVALSKSRKDGDNFMGMKKGFLLDGFGSEKSKNISKSKTTKSPPKSKVEDIPVIKPKQGEQEKYRIQEVQDAMKKMTPLLQNSDWITSDLLEKVEKHPRLAQQMANPDFARVLTKVEKDPEGATRELQNNPQLQDVFKDFCSILGDHFTSLSDQSPSSSTQNSKQYSQGSGIQTREAPGIDMTVRSSSSPNQPTADDEIKMKAILSDPEVFNIFSDERMKELMDALKFNPEKAQGMIQRADPEMKKKIQKLIDVGLLTFSS
ncbi:hypothetical protein HOLleu_32043 [Holothuria leucospilota]|uniref:STI1 domain-containing protein n=1 Tax=Holothuria leucospilota TaxID=206669 RepID=A0A9Q0YTJ8_HOLLE|nr:hypothetical protein HOLleu_32043 [Holothuria leucospilota]